MKVSVVLDGMRGIVVGVFSNFDAAQELVGWYCYNWYGHPPEMCSDIGIMDFEIDDPTIRDSIKKDKEELDRKLSPEGIAEIHADMLKASAAAAEKEPHTDYERLADTQALKDYEHIKASLSLELNKIVNSIGLFKSRVLSDSPPRRCFLCYTTDGTLIGINGPLFKTPEIICANRVACRKRQEKNKIEESRRYIGMVRDVVAIVRLK